MTPRFAFLGTPAFAATILEALVRQGWIPELVISEPAKPAGRGHRTTPSAVAVLAERHHLRLETPATKDELASLLAQLNLDLAIVVAYGKIIPETAIALPKLGMVNVHASLLPKYRGASPIQAAILSGDAHTGLSYMLIEPTLDTGPVIRQVTHAITPTTTSQQLFDELAELAGRTIVPTLEAYLATPATITPQDHAQATYSGKLTKDDGQVVLREQTPEVLDRLVRAYTPWPGVYTTEFGPRLLLRRGHLDHGRYVIDELQWEGKRAVDGPTFARAYPAILTQLPEVITLTTSRTPVSGSTD